jgi:hypothetical protein
LFYFFVFFFIFQIIMSPTAASSDVKKESATARLLGSGKSFNVMKYERNADLKLLLGSAGIAELMIFHPVRPIFLRCKIHCDPALTFPIG